MLTTGAAKGVVVGEYLQHRGPAAVRRLTVVVAGSRSGSSWLHEQLRARGRFITLQGEVSPIRRRWERSASCGEVEVLGRAVLAEAGIAPRTLADISGHSRVYVDSMLERLKLQWPRALWDMCKLTHGLETASRKNGGLTTETWSCDRARVLDAIVDSTDSRINRANYDRGSTLAEGAPTVTSDNVVDTPFVIPVPQISPTHRDLGERPLLLKGPEETRHLEIWLATFPNATVDVVVLTRNPMASINGLMDGWLSRYFHSRYVGSELRVPELAGHRDREWWKFDVIPDVREYLRAPLARIACRQWSYGLEGVRQALASADSHSDRIGHVYTLSYSALLSGAGAEFGKLLDGVGVDEQPSIPYVMAVNTDPMRWKHRGDEIADAIMREGIADQVDAYWSSAQAMPSGPGSAQILSAATTQAKPTEKCAPIAW